MFSTQLPRLACFLFVAYIGGIAGPGCYFGPGPGCDFCGESPFEEEPPGCIAEDDGDPCTDDICTVGGPTTHVPNTGGSCDDNNQCTRSDRCAAGICIGGDPIVCAEGNACSDGVCSKVCQGATGSIIPFDSANDIALADMNGDGAKDLIVVGGSLKIFLNTGNGTFGETIQISVENQSDALAVADLNGDGRQDIVVSTQGPGMDGVDGPAGLTILLQQQDGTFAGNVEHSATYHVAALKAVDVNNDGLQDIISLYSGSGFDIFMNLGGTFSQPQHYSGGGNTFSVADLNGDGFPELAIGRHIAGLAVLFNDGQGHFVNSDEYPLTNSTAAIAIADVDSNGTMDLAVNHLTSVAIMLNDGTGKLTLTAELEASSLALDMVAADFNGDGSPDFAAANYGAGSVSVRYNQGDGTFSPMLNVVAGPSPISIAAGDLDGDGALDLAAGSLQGGVSVYLNGCLH